jgi:hypothetical protein
VNAYEKLSEVVMTAPQFPTVNRDLLQDMLKQYRQLFLAVEARLGVDPLQFAQEHDKARRAGAPATTMSLGYVGPEYVAIADVREVLGAHLPQGMLDRLQDDPRGRKMLGIK